MMEDLKCVMGCMHFTGGEVKHHKDCPFYPESLSQLIDEQEILIKEYLAQSKGWTDEDLESAIEKGIEIGHESTSCNYHSTGDPSLDRERADREVDQYLKTTKRAMSNENEPKTEYEFYKQQYEKMKKKAAHKDAKQLEEEIRSVAEALADKASNVKHSVLWEEVKRHSEKAIKAYLTITGLESYKAALAASEYLQQLKEANGKDK